MNKITKRVVAVVSAALMLTTSAYAMQIDSYYGESTTLSVNTEKRNQLHFVGSADGNSANRMATLIIMKPGKTLNDADNGDNIEYMNTVSVAFEGDFEFTLNFEKESGTYPVYVICGGQTYSHNYIFKSWEDVLTLFSKIKDESITYDYFKDYADVFGIDLSVITKEGYKDTFITRINADKNLVTYDDEGVQVIKNVLDDCMTEFKYLESIKTAENWAKLPQIISDISTLTGITYDYNGKSQQTVCQKLIDREFTSAEKLKEAFDKAVEEAGTTGGSTSSNGGGGSYTTGGGSTGNYSSVNPTTIATPVPQQDTTNAFSDLDSVSWAVKPINYLYNKGMINGTGEGKFSPNNYIKREEIVKIIMNAFELNDDTAVAAFDDVSADAWYYKYIAGAKAKGVVNGISETEFGVGRNVTRQDMSVMIYNAAVLAGEGFTSKKTDFADFDSVSDYAQEAVACLAGSGIINGMDDGSFAPQDNATRAQAAKMIYAIIGE